MELREGYKQTEVGVIPDDWESLKIERIVSEISMGPFGSDIKVSNFVSEGVPVLSGANIKTEKLVDGFVNYVTPEKAKSLKKAVASRGDIVVTHRGTLGQIAYIPHDSAYKKYAISQSQFRARFNNEVNPSWIALYFLSRRGSKALLEGKGHTGVPAIAQATTTFRKLYIPLPTLKEQTAIAGALSDADALIQFLTHLIAKKRQIKQGAMQILLTGTKRLPGFEQLQGYKETDLGKTPNDWDVKSLPEIVTFIHGKAHEQFIVDTAKYEVVNSKFVSTEGRVKKYSGENFCKAKSNDILMVLSDLPNGKALAKCFYVEIDEKYAVNQRVCIYRTKKYNPKYLYYILNRNPYFLNLDDGVTQTHILNDDIKKCRLLIPTSVEEQKAIATILSDMDADIAALETKLAKTQQIKQGMMQNLLTGRIRLI